MLWRGGLRISEALALSETDVDERRGSLLIRHVKGDKRREAGMDDWGFEQLHTWLEHRVELPVGPLFCVIDGPIRGRRSEHHPTPARPTHRPRDHVNVPARIDPSEIIDAVRSRRQPTISATAGLEL